MDRRWAILGLIVLVTTVAWAGPLKDDDDDDEGRQSDFSLFTTQVDDSVTCKARRTAELHLTATNLDAEEVRINIVFEDNDSLLVMVPTGESFSLTQTIGTNRGVDTTITIDPLDQDGDVNPMVGWASIHALKGDSGVSCTVNTFTPGP